MDCLGLVKCQIIMYILINIKNHQTCDAYIERMDKGCSSNKHFRLFKAAGSSYERRKVENSWEKVLKHSRELIFKHWKYKHILYIHTYYHCKYLRIRLAHNNIMYIFREEN